VRSTMSGETGAFLASLDSERRHVLGILEGLDEETLRRAVLPSGWSCLGLVRHLALDVERFWFRGTIAAEAAVIEEVGNASEDGWNLGPEESAQHVFTVYRQEIERANQILTTVALDAAPAWWPEFFGDNRMQTVREVVLHVLAETSCHAGHLDAARELLDGRQWMVLD
jgi:uncharacterized damage-inducible protein DinB